MIILLLPGIYAICRQRLILHWNFKTFLSHGAILPRFGPNLGNRLRAFQNVLNSLCKFGFSGDIALKESLR